MNVFHPPRPLLPLLLACLLPLAATAQAGSINDGIGTALDQARQEVQHDLAAARAELETGNLEVGSGLDFGNSGRHGDKGGKPLPRAEITPQGDFLIEGRPVGIDQTQRQQLLAYRGQVIGIAKAGIDIGERSAQVAIEAVDRGLFSLMFAAMTGNLGRNLEKSIKQSIEPGVMQICRSLPALRDSQQRLADSLPQFRPYATLEAGDIEDCENNIREEFAQNL